MSLPRNPQSRFLHDLAQSNQPQMAALTEWLFQPGMLFKAPEKWWGDQGARYTPHEGLDLYSFLKANGTRHTVDQHTRIPAAFDGAVVKIAPDFLGQSIYLRHEIISPGGRQLISIYGHTVPCDSLRNGHKVAAGEIIGCISGFPGRKTTLVPHLHLTFAWVPVPVPLELLNWQKLGSEPRITLIDPLSMLAPLATT
jgi:murein DD-endopeptidase MepM/ murein hydrolase activator NlpD